MSRVAVLPAGALTRAAPGFADIDWSRPWFAQVAALGVRWQQAALRGASEQLHAMNADAASADITTGRGKRLAFIPQDELPPGTAYEAHIAATGCVPTRHNLHDFFNALTWFQFPRIKAALSARGAAAVDALGIGPTRGGVRDALTVFDENAVLFVSSDSALSTALRSFDWKALFIEERAAWDTHCEVRCFGHALLEKLVMPYKACTGHAWIVPVPSAYFSWARASRDAFLDDAVARALLEGGEFSSRMFAPLPVLGIPGWCAENGTESFYDDPAVFRSGRRSRVLADGKIAASKAGQAVAASAVSTGEGEESPDSTGQGDG